MKIIVSIFLFLGLSLLSAVSFADPASGSTQSDSGAAANSKTNSADTQKTDGQILKTIMVIDDNELDVAHLALKKSTNAEVKKFAQVMITQHSQNLKQAKKILNENKIYPQTSDKSLALETEGKNVLDKLTGLQGNDFDIEYIHAMVDGHKKALSLITDELIPKASNPKLLNFVKSTSVTVSNHLKMAEQTQKQLS